MIPMISIPELYEKYKNIDSNELILDVRTSEEFSEGHIPGSKNISYDEVLQNIGELKKYEKVYLYCRSGNRVQKACFDLMNAGFKNIIAVVDGGMPDWVECGYPVEK